MNNTTTYKEAINHIKINLTLRFSMRMSLLYDTVFQAIDEYAISKAYAKRGIIKEVVHILSSLDKTGIDSAVKPLLEALQKKEHVCIENICVFGRTLCELMALALLKQHDLKVHPMLMNNIETLRQSKIIAPWICSYMHSLRIFGNETVHMRETINYRPKGLDENDLIAALSAIKSLAAFWMMHYNFMHKTQFITRKES